MNNSNHSFYECLSASWKHGYEKEYFWLSGVLLSIVAIIGFIGNIINIVVLCQPELRQKVFYKLLVVLAIFDSIFIISYGISIGYQSMACQPSNGNVGHLTYPILNVGLTGSIYMTIVISLER